MNGACDAVGLKRAAYYRALQLKVTDVCKPPLKRESHRKLSAAQRAILLAVMNSEEFIDQPPREVYGALLSRGEYFGSVRTCSTSSVAMSWAGCSQRTRTRRSPSNFLRKLSLAMASLPKSSQFIMTVVHR